MAEANSRFHLPPKFYDPNEDPSELYLPKEELTDSEVRQQISSAESPFSFVESNSFRNSINPINGVFPSSSSSSLPYSVYQRTCIQNNGGFPAQSWNNGGFPAQSWNNGGFPAQSWNNGGFPAQSWNNGVFSVQDFSPQTYFRAPPSSFSSPAFPYSVYQRPYIQNNGGFPASQAWNNNGGSNTVDWSYCDTSVSSSWKALEAYKKMKIAEFKNYLKLKRRTEEQIQYFESCKDPILLHEYYGLDIHMMCMNQLGSQYLQSVTQTETAEIILDAVLKGIFQVMRDPSGNLVFQKLVNCCVPEQLQKIVYALSRAEARAVFIDLVMSENGMMCVQTLMDRLNAQELPVIHMVLDALEPCSLELMKNRWGTQLIQFCMKILNPYQIRFIYKTVKLHFLELAVHCEGYVVVLKATKNLLVHKPLRMELLKLVTDHAVHLAQDHRGSILIQELLRNEDESFTELVVSQLLESGDLVDIACTEYGTFTVQNLIDSCKSRRPELYQAVAAVLTQHQEQLKTHPKGAWVWAKIIR